MYSTKLIFAGLMVPGLQFIPSGKTKAVYFIKRQLVALTADGIKTQIMFGDLSYSPLAQLGSLIEDVSLCIYFKVIIFWAEKKFWN